MISLAGDGHHIPTQDARRTVEQHNGRSLNLRPALNAGVDVGYVEEGVHVYAAMVSLMIRLDTPALLASTASTVRG